MFREIPVNGAATVLPISVDVEPATFATNATSGNLENRGASDNSYKPKQVILNADRLDFKSPLWITKSTSKYSLT